LAGLDPVNKNMPDETFAVLYPDDVRGRAAGPVEEEKVYLPRVLGKEGEVHPVGGGRGAEGPAFSRGDPFRGPVRQMVRHGKSSLLFGNGSGVLLLYNIKSEHDRMGRGCAKKRTGRS
jgi:hypothetical protein